MQVGALETILAKTRLLPAEDWARIATMSADNQQRALTALLNGRAPFSYRPLRKHFGDLLGLSYPLFSMEDAPLAEVLTGISRCARSGDEREANGALAKLIYESLRMEEFQAIAEPFQRLSLGLGLTLGYCADAIFTRGDEVYVLAFNLRRSAYTDAAAKFVFSVMHEQSRALNADLADARLAIMHFPQPKDGERHLDIRYANDMPRYSYEELAGMTARTQTLWVVAQEDAELKKRSSEGAARSWWDSGTATG